MNREDLFFQSEDCKCAAWLYLPESGAPAPVLIMAHGLGGVRTMRLDAFAERFCEAGYACLVFDYRTFGDSEGNPRQLLDINMQLKDWENAIAFIKKDLRIDSKRLIVWGTSFGGGHALQTAATISGVSGVISQCPFTDGLSSSLALHPISMIRVGYFAFLDMLTKAFLKTPITVPLFNAPGKTGLMTANDVVDGIDQLMPNDVDNPPDYVAARIGLKIGLYFPGKVAKNIACPALVIACLKDTVAPAKPTIKYAKKIKLGEVVEMDTGHFNIYVGEWFEKNISVQLDWLQRHFPT